MNERKELGREVKGEGRRSIQRISRAPRPEPTDSLSGRFADQVVVEAPTVAREAVRGSSSGAPAIVDRIVVQKLWKVTVGPVVERVMGEFLS